MRRRPHGPASWLAPAIAALALAAGACDDPSPPVRGFGSRQLVQTNDRTLALLTFGTVVVPVHTSDGTYYSPEIDPNILHYRTGDPTVAGSTVSFWALNLTDGTVTSLGSEVPEVVIPPPEPVTKFLKCWTEETPPGVTVFIEDPISGTTLMIDRVRAYASCPKADDPYFVAIRLDEAERGRLWAGPYNDLQQTPVRVSIDTVLTSNILSAADPTERHVTVAGATDAAPDRLGIYDIPLDNFRTTEVVPSTLADGAWAAGATPEGPLESDGLVAGSSSVLAGPSFLYSRRMRDGTQTIFVRPTGGGSPAELALFRSEGLVRTVRIGSYAEPVDGGIEVRSINAAAWQHTPPSAGSPDSVRFWDPEQARLLSCPLAVPVGTSQPFLAAFPTPGGRNVIFAASANSGDDVPIGPLLVASRDAPLDDACRMLAPDRVFAQTWSSEAIAWLQATDTVAEHELWTATIDGKQPRRLGTGWLRGPRFSSPFEVDFYFATDLVSVDVRVDPVRPRYLAEEVFGALYSSTTSVVTGYDYNSQDATGTLGVIQRSSGERRDVSRAVDQFRLLYKGYEGSLSAVYFVRGRNPSAQDGIWVATITADDLD